MKKNTVEKILTETEIGYDLIAQKFSQTRKHFWRGLEFLADFAKPGDQVLDFGCGNGRLLELLGDKELAQYHGVDVSGELLKLAKEKYATENRRFSKLDSSRSSLAFESEFFNSIYSIAVFHHLPSQAKREEVAKELYRVLKKDGHVVVTVWNLWQSKYYKNILQNRLRKIFLLSKLDWNDCRISFTDNAGKKFERFHHAFTERELRELFEKAGFVIESCEVVAGRNIVLVGKK